MKKIHGHIISNTHWDREWRYPFQAYRMDLVDMMDRLLGILEKRPDYRAFFLDSQTVILEDYLEIRPENESRVRSLVQADRIQIGPWYTLPDEWACPGEALVRNLLMGHRSAKLFGPVAKVGYTPFSNGQISQLPQLYQGFGIDSCFFYRGIGKHVAKSDFLWESPDGSQVYGFRFGDYARYNYYFLVYRPGLLGRTTKDRDYVWDPAEIPFRVASDQSQDRQYSWIAQRLQVHEDRLQQALADARQYTEKDAETSHLLYMMGHDHSFAAEEELALIEAAQKHLDPQTEEVFHSTLADYMKAFREEAKDLKVLRGEMRHTNKEGLWTNLMALILSSRLYLKVENARVCAKMLQGAEPLAALAWREGSEYPSPYLDLAWKKLLINQAHDAIGGCSVDRVHEEMRARWGEVDTLCDEICRRSMRDLACRIDGGALAENDLQLTVFNTLPFERSEAAAFTIDLPHADAEEPFTVETLDGNPVAMQLLSRRKHQPTIEGGYELPMPFEVQRSRVLLDLKDLPSLGHDVLVIKRGQRPVSSGDSIVKSPTELENELLRVALNRNGTLRLTDRKTGRTFDRLAGFEDTAEFGDPWNRIAPADDSPIYSKNAHARVETIEEGPLSGAFRVSFELKVPCHQGEGMKRSEELCAIPIALTVRLKKGSPVLDLTIDLDNRARDHRLRVLFPTGLPHADHSFAEGQFDVLQRAIAPPSAEGWKEAPYPTHPMWNFVEVSDGKNALAVINDGLTEYEVIDNETRAIAITLLRAYGKFVFGRPTPGAQCLGPQNYRFALYPHQGWWQESGIFLETARHLAPLQALQSAPTRGQGSARASFIRQAAGAMTLSAIKQAEDGQGLIVRLWNPLEEAQAFTLETAWKIAQAEEVTLEELPVRPLAVEKGHRIAMTAGKKKIVTLRIQFEKERLLDWK